jgi:hypothetical protein
MGMWRTAAAVVLVLGLATLAWAGTQTGSWLRGCQAGQTSASVTPGQFVCYLPAAGSANNVSSPIVDVTACESFDLYLSDDRDGDGGADCTIPWIVETCPVSAAVDTDAERDAACAVMDDVSNLSSTNRDEVNLGAARVRVTGAGSGTAPEDCQVELKCASGPKT